MKNKILSFKEKKYFDVELQGMEKIHLNVEVSDNGEILPLDEMDMRIIIQLRTVDKKLWKKLEEELKKLAC